MFYISLYQSYKNMDWSGYKFSDNDLRLNLIHTLTELNEALRSQTKMLKITWRYSNKTLMVYMQHRLDATTIPIVEIKCTKDYLQFRHPVKQRGKTTVTNKEDIEEALTQTISFSKELIENLHNN